MALEEFDPRDTVQAVIETSRLHWASNDDQDGRDNQGDTAVPPVRKALRSASFLHAHDQRGKDRCKARTENPACP